MTRDLGPGRRALLMTVALAAVPLLLSLSLGATAQESLPVQGCEKRAGENPSGGNAVSTEQEIIDLSRSKWRWMAARDLSSLDNLFHEKSVFVHMGATFSKEQELDVIQSGYIQYKHTEIHEASVRFIGSTAILLNRIRMDSIVDGKEVSNPFQVTEVYINENGAWKLGSLSFTRLVIH